MSKYNYAIEIGGSFTKIYVKEEGFALCEPTLVAAEPTSDGYKIVAFGQEAKNMMGKTSENIEVFSPIINGEIKNYQYLKLLLEYFFDKVGHKKKKDSVLVLVNLGLSAKEKNKFISLLYELEFKEVSLLPTIICSCIGVGKSISSTKSVLVANIGGANTDVAVINMNSIVKGATLGLGGRAVDVAIANQIAYNHGIVLGLSTSEKLKVEVGSLYENDTLNMEVTGVDCDTKIPTSYIISSSDLLPVLEPFFDEIVRTIDVTITSLAPEISADIISGGVVFVGGMAKTNGLDHYLKKHLRYPFKIADDAENVSILGAGKLLEDEKLLSKLIDNI